MANEVINKDDLHDVRNQLGEQMQRGFLQITTRLDILNGRVGKGEVESAIQRVRLDGLEGDVKERRSTDAIARKAEPLTTAEEDQAAITRRDLKVAVAVIGAIYIIGQFLFKAGPWLAKVVTP
jgi:hypothetical protein